MSNDSDNDLEDKMSDNSNNEKEKENEKKIEESNEKKIPIQMSMVMTNNPFPKDNFPEKKKILPSVDNIEKKKRRKKIR